MRRKSNRQRVNRLFVLGAGASMSSSLTRSGTKERHAPLDSQFCERIKEVEAHRPGWVNGARDFVLKEWKDHIPFESLALEDAIIRQMGHMEFIDAIHPNKKKKSVTKEAYLNNLSHLICYVLRKTKESNHRYYGRLIDHYFAGAFDGITNRIITFNYDDMVDRHLLKTHNPGEIYFDRIKGRRDARRKRDVVCEHPLLIKLHGSVNWRCRTEDFETIVQGNHDSKNKQKIEVVWQSSTGTPAPDDDASPLIIPPLPQKPITQVSLFQYLWTKAYEYLHEAHEIVICGYSLPQTDNLAQSLFANFSNQNLHTVTVIDPNPGIMKRWRDLFRRKNVPAGTRWRYFEDFGEYIDAVGA
ncbi:SIR2 family protein [Halorhodospira sp. 9621]|uniref:SIR2 family protein n=1 Tax=Halorhodospira sp. 9621 TaxID=2899135 RepID=UPI001EE914A6|nr:SIR2 family protein [Halorhodospira sp. 9621]MCG5534352.1 SIR2 family protein [Halorhodospira sp. 9621]